MAIETRAGCRYYYQKYRVNGKVKSRYVGAISSPAIAQIAEMDAIDFKVKRNQLAQQKAELARMIEFDNSIADLIQFNRVLVKASLIIAGYHQHKREWRKARAD